MVKSRILHEWIKLMQLLKWLAKMNALKLSKMVLNLRMQVLWIVNTDDKGYKQSKIYFLFSLTSILRLILVKHILFLYFFSILSNNFSTLLSSCYFILIIIFFYSNFSIMISLIWYFSKQGSRSFPSSPTAK